MQYRVSAVTEMLADCCYQVCRDASQPAVPDLDAAGLVQRYTIEPGPASLTMQTAVSGGGVEFVFEGPRFGIGGQVGDKDLVLWTRLVTLGAENTFHYRALFEEHDIPSDAEIRLQSWVVISR